MLQNTWFNRNLTWLINLQSNGLHILTLIPVMPCEPCLTERQPSDKLPFHNLKNKFWTNTRIPHFLVRLGRQVSFKGVQQPLVTILLLPQCVSLPDNTTLYQLFLDLFHSLVLWSKTVSGKDSNISFLLNFLVSSLNWEAGLWLRKGSSNLCQCGKTLCVDADAQNWKKKPHESHDISSPLQHPSLVYLHLIFWK